MKKKYYLILDTETATLPFVNDYAKNEKQKQTIAIAKPLVYDIGWLIMDRQGNIVKVENFLVQETFFVPNVFNTAYYKDKRPLYMDMFKNQQIDALPWNEIVEILLEDLRRCDIAAAYNATFDFKKAIPFTERYIKALYSDWYNDYEEKQRISCYNIINGNGAGKNKDFLTPVFELRQEEFPIVDLWLLSCQKLINNNRYRDYCLKNKLLTNSGTFFKTSAESTYQYLTGQHDFIESHTALDDALIEAQILVKLLRKGKVEAELGSFPFSELGYTYKYVREERPKYINVVIEAIEEYLKGVETFSAYSSKLENILHNLYALIE